MVYTINAVFDDAEADRLREIKSGTEMTWAEIILEALEFWDEHNPQQSLDDVGEQAGLEESVGRRDVDVGEPKGRTQTVEMGDRSDQDDAGDQDGVDPDLEDLVAHPAIADLDVPGSGEKVIARLKTIDECYDLLRERGTAEKQDFLDLVDVDAVEYASPESFWSNCIKGHDTLRTLPGVEPPTQGGGDIKWRYNPE